MAFFDDLGDSLGRLGKTVAGRAKNAAETGNLKIQIANAQKEVTKAYAELGKKYAELNADKDDDFNRGSAQMRMGNLYKVHNAYDGRDLEKYEEAVKSFRKCNNNHYLLIALRDLGALYRYRKADKAEEILKEAIRIFWSFCAGRKRMHLA